MTYFYKNDPINDIFYESYINKPDRNNFWDSPQKFFCATPKFWPFSSKNDLFDKIDPINEIFDPSYVKKPD